MSYAAGTSADAARTQAEIQNALSRLGADGFMSGQRKLQDGREAAMIAFEFQGKTIRFTMFLPHRELPEFQSSAKGRVKYDVNQRYKLWEQACKARWRALLLAIKAKLVAVEEGISTVEQEFMAWMVLPNGRTAGEHFLPQIQEAANNGQMPRLSFDEKGGGQ